MIKTIAEKDYDHFVAPESLHAPLGNQQIKAPIAWYESIAYIDQYVEDQDDRNDQIQQLGDYLIKNN